jgi:hypothetical protein
MGWELWNKETDYGWTHFGFFCNTADESFGPVLGVERDFGGDLAYARSRFYEHWEQASRDVMGFHADPRSVGNDMLLRISHRTFVICGWMSAEEYRSYGYEDDEE